jgi:hypothetical protein
MHDSFPLSPQASLTDFRWEKSGNRRSPGVLPSFTSNSFAGDFMAKVATEGRS